MTAKIRIESNDDLASTFALVKSAISAEIARLEMAIDLSAKRLAPFEKKYRVTSEHFIAEMAADDLDGEDDEYVSWMGEFQLKKKLEEKLSKLKNIEYEN